MNKIKTFLKNIPQYILVGILLLAYKMIKGKLHEYEKTKTKIKHFKPTIKEGILFNSVSWEMRDKPLTDEELKNLSS